MAHELRVAVFKCAGLRDRDRLFGRGTRYSLVASCGHTRLALGSVVVASGSAAGAAGTSSVVPWPKPPGDATCYTLGGSSGSNTSTENSESSGGDGGGANSVEALDHAGAWGLNWPLGQVPDVILSLYRHLSRGSPDAADGLGSLCTPLDPTATGTGTTNGTGQGTGQGADTTIRADGTT